MLKNIVYLTLLLSQTVLANGLATDNFKTVGEARMSHLFWDIYDAKLLTPNGVYQPGQYPIVLSLTYLRDIDASDIVQATNEQWKHLGQNELVGRYDQQLLGMWPDIKQGDNLSLLVTSEGNANFYYNQIKVGQIQNENFSRQFLAIWLSPNTSQPRMRDQLINPSISK